MFSEISVILSSILRTPKVPAEQPETSGGARKLKDLNTIISDNRNLF